MAFGLGEEQKPAFEPISGSRTAGGFWRRWGHGLQRTLFVSNFVTQNARVDRDWQADDRLLWGAFCQGVTVGPAPAFPACGLFSGTKEVLIRKIDFRATFATNSQVHIATLGEGIYNPVAITPGRFYPWCSSAKDNTLFPESVLFGGYSNTLPSYDFGGGATPAIGPTYAQNAVVDIPTVFYGETKTILDFSDPPLIIPPDSICFLQEWSLGVAFAPQTLDANFWFSERLYGGR